uniref:Dimer_Tnp_hAT domain-containing protein n=1 Tax=Steinernema glaseri TaxID=37863 RepID=A0A1I8AE56_9BILA
TLLDPRFKAGFFQFTNEKRDMLLSEAKQLAAEQFSEGCPTDGYKEETLKSRNFSLTPEVKNPFSRFLEAEKVCPTPKSNADIVEALAKARQEVDEYFASPPNPECDPYQFWATDVSQIKFPLLRQLALSYLSCPATSLASGEPFPPISHLDTRLSKETVQKILFLHGNISLLGDK